MTIKKAHIRTALPYVLVLLCLLGGIAISNPSQKKVFQEHGGQANYGGFVVERELEQQWSRDTGGVYIATVVDLEEYYVPLKPQYVPYFALHTNDCRKGTMVHYRIDEVLAGEGWTGKHFYDCSGSTSLYLESDSVIGTRKNPEKGMQMIIFSSGFESYAESWIGEYIGEHCNPWQPKYNFDVIVPVNHGLTTRSIQPDGTAPYWMAIHDWCNLYHEYRTVDQLRNHFANISASSDAR
jgi:hypothetical protein